MDLDDARMNTGTDASTTGGAGTERLSEIREGMTVIDAAGEEIGKVAFVKMGDPQAATTVGQGMDSRGEDLVGVAVDLFGGDNEPNLPEAQRASFLRSGFLKIDCGGLFATDRYVSASQISGVSNDAVRLSATKEQLAKEA